MKRPGNVTFAFLKIDIRHQDPLSRAPLVVPTHHTEGGGGGGGSQPTIRRGRGGGYDSGRFWTECVNTNSKEMGPFSA